MPTNPGQPTEFDTFILDPAAIRTRRLSLGISTSALAKMLGVTAMVIDWLEHGSDQGHLTMSFVSDLALALGATPADLLDAESVAATPVDTEPDGVEDTDPATVGRTLAAAGRVHVDELARSLGWTSGRTRWALHLLEDRLGAVGQTLAWLADTEVQVAPTPGDTTIASIAGRRSIQARGLQESDARFVHLMASQKGGSLPGKLDQMSLNRLVTADVVTVAAVPRTDRQKPTAGLEAARLSEEARFNLYLD